MDHSRLISVVKEFPQVWDRNCALFREKEHKQAAWQRIGQLMNQSASICRDAFKSLREKYVREREKQAMFAEKYLPWSHLDTLSFLDPHIVLRKPSINFDNDQFTCNQITNASFPMNLTETNNSNNNNNNSHSDFDRSLIGMVKKATPIWDRKSNGYPSKQLKYQLWKTIAQALNRDINICMTRWKGLREKYIRQKMKYQDGEAKWEFLDDMSFLDHVIQYRRKQCDPFDNNRFSNGHLTITPIEALNYHQSPDHHQQQQHHNNDHGDDSINDSSSGGDLFVKSEGCDSVQDCSYDSGMMITSRKRSASDNSECSSYDKRDRIDTTTDCINIKTPEQVFGDLVATMLAKKTEREKNIAMIEIMKILTR